MRKILFIDRDGTLIIEPEDQQIDSLEKLEFYPSVFQGLTDIVKQNEFALVMVTNQDGLGTSSFPEDTFWPAHTKMLTTFANEGISFQKIFIDRSFEKDNLPTRKPGTGMLTEFLQEEIDVKNSYVIGDRLTDVQLAKNLNCNAILINDGSLKDALEQKQLTDNCKLITTSWIDIANFIKQPPRISSVERITKETTIAINLNLDGSGIASNKTGLGFFDHMLDQLAKHGKLDLSISVSGDLHIDEHHTIEDTALALGEAFAKAIGDKRGIERYGFSLPMDDCLAQVALDFGGRPWLVWEVDFKREKIGEMPTEMFIHFFKSFSDTAKCNLNIKAEGVNEHHKIEGIFKAFAKSIKMAVKREGNDLPTTKGVL